MAGAAKKEYEIERKSNQSNVRHLVMEAIDQAKQGKTKDFNDVCERLEKKYTRA